MQLTHVKKDDKKPVQTDTCTHCQEPCLTEIILGEGDTVFCCNGCKMVYTLLSDHGLCQYYDLDSQSGISLKNQADARAYAWLDDAETAQSLLDFDDGTIATVRFYLPQIHCASCIWLLENLYKLDEGVLSSRINFSQKTCSIRFSKDQTSLRRLAALLATLGYAPKITLNDTEVKQQTSQNKVLLYKIGLTGFVFGNTMLLSFPEYLGLQSLTDAAFGRFFSYINLLLSLPILFYSAADYLKSAWLGLKMRHLNIDVPLSLGILAIFFRSSYEILFLGEAGYLDSLVGLVFFLLVGKWFQQRTCNQLSFDRDYRSYFPVAAQVRKNGTTQAMPLHKLAPGDTVELRHGELIPADGQLIKGEAQIDYSFVTGEADTQAVQMGEKLYAGGRQMGGLIEMSLTKRVDQSYLTKLWNEENYQNEGAGKIQYFADSAGRWFTFLVLFVGFSTLAYWLLKGQTALAFDAFTAVLIVACPCAVALSIPFTLGNGLRILGKNGFFLKNTQAMEALVRTDAAVFDKTGTLTENGAQNLTFAPMHNKDLSSTEQSMLRSLVGQSAHPKSQQIYNFLEKTALLPVENFEEKMGLGLQAMIAGKQIALGSPDFLKLKKEHTKGVYVQIEGELKGYFSSESRFRSHLKEVLAFFGQQQTLFLLSGDNDSDAEKLRPFFPNQSVELHFNQSPQSKLDFIKKLQNRGKSVLMLGDGLNDAGALRQAEVGISITENTNNFTPACKGILNANAFETLPLFIQYAQKTVTTVRWAFFLAALYNIIGLTYACSGNLSPVVAAILMPLSSISIVLFGMGLSSFWAWKMGLLDKNDVNHSLS